MTINTTDYTGGGSAIDEVAVKISSGVDKARLFDAPDGGTWRLVNGGLSANGCSGSGAGFECADWISVGSAALIKGTYTWVFDIDVKGTVFSFDGSTELPSIKVRYIDASGNKVGALVSERSRTRHAHVVGCRPDDRRCASPPRPRLNEVQLS